MQNDIHQSVEQWTERIRTIDKLLEPAISGLIDLAIWNLELSDHPFRTWVKEPMYFPAWVTDEREPDPPSAINLTTPLCVKTLQRLWTKRRRYPAIEKKLEELKKAIDKRCEPRDVAEFLADTLLPPAGPDAYSRYLSRSALMSAWHPHSTAIVLWVLLRGGEAKAYTGAGVFALFAMLWSMHGSGGVTGASTGVLPPSAYVTNTCLAAITSLTDVCKRRAAMVKEIAALIEQIDRSVKTAHGPVANLPFDVDALLNLLARFRRIAVTGEAFDSRLGSIDKLVAGLTIDSRAADVWAKVRSEIQEIVRKIGARGQSLVDELQEAIRLLDTIHDAVNAVADGGDEETCLNKLREYNIELGVSRFTSDEPRRRFWRERAEAADRARRACREAVKAFARSIKACLATADAESSTLIEAFRSIEQSNRDVVEAIARPLEPVQRWCDQVVMREIANASSRNWTEFDPAELAGGLEVAALSGEIESVAMVEDAVLKAAQGLRGGGGWVAGQPFMLDKTYSLSAAAPAADVVFTLARILRRYPKVTAADEALLEFVEWAGVTRTEYSVEQIAGRPLKGKIKLTGWVSERQARPERVDLWCTTYMIDALLELRALFEDRLWMLCEHRFTIVESKSGLRAVQATDHDTPHVRRLQRKLSEMVRKTSGTSYRNANYSMVLHGPPGSSKTKIIEAVASELWQSDSGVSRATRLIRITPADFTRRGESLIDSEARDIFNLLGHVRRVTILFDEIDDLLRRRKFEEQPSFLKLVVPAMLNRLQDLRDACARQEICFILATNYIDNIEPALIRKGRIDEVIPLVYPDRSSRAALVDDRLARLPSHNAWAASVARPLLIGTMSDRWPFKVIDGCCDAVLAVVDRVANGGAAAVKTAVERIVKSESSAGTSPYNAQRLHSLTISEPFQQEFLAYLLSGTSSESEFLSAVEKALVDLPDLVIPMQAVARKAWRSSRSIE